MSCKVLVVEDEIFVATEIENIVAAMPRTIEEAADVMSVSDERSPWISRLLETLSPAQRTYEDAEESISGVSLF